MTDYHSVKTLETDAAFRRRILLSLLVSALLVIATIYGLLITKLVVKPIVGVTLSDAVVQNNTGQHILTTAEFVGLMKKSNELPPAGTKISGYVTDLDKICDARISDVIERTNLVVATTSNNQFLGIASPSAYNCKNAEFLHKNENVQITSDNPIFGADSKPVIMTLDYKTGQ